MRWMILFVLIGSRPLIAAEPFPANVLDLAGWKLTVPEQTKRAGDPDEIQSSELATFHDERFFHLNDAGDGVVFRAPCGGATTKNSDYPRCELREMRRGGIDAASWSTEDRRRHVLQATLAVTRLPKVKDHVVCAQIHDAEDDLLMIRLEGEKLFVERNDVGDVMLDDGYELGQPFRLRIVAAGGTVEVYYQGERKLAWEVARDGCYFKLGCYTQSNVDRGDEPDAYGEVVVFRLGAER